MKGLKKFGAMLVTSLLLVLAVLACVPQTAEAAIFGSRSRQVVVQRQQVVRQQVVRQKVVQVQQVQAVYAAPVVQQVRVQQVYVPQAFRQQLNGDCHNSGGVLQLNGGGCAALYGR